MDEELLRRIAAGNRTNIEKSLVEIDSQDLTQMPLSTMVTNYIFGPIQRIYNRGEYLLNVSRGPGSQAWKDLMTDFAAAEILISKAKINKAYEELQRRDKQLNF